MSDRAEGIANRCAYGHSAKHIDEFSDLEIHTPEQYREHIKSILESRETECFTSYSTKQNWRQADIFYNESTNTLVISPEDYNREPTAYRPENGREIFDNKHKEAENIEDKKIEKYHGINELEQDKQTDLNKEKSEEATLQADRDIAATVMEREEAEQEKDLEKDDLEK